MQQAQEAHDPALLLLAESSLGHTCFYMGKFLSARKHLEMATSIYDPERHRPLVLRYLGLDAGVDCLIHLALSLWQLGYPDEALTQGDKAITLAQRQFHPHSTVFGKFFFGVLRQYQRDASAVEETMKGVVALSVEHGLNDWFAWATILRGWAVARQGRNEEGIEQMHEGQDALRSTGSEWLRPYLLYLLADACDEAGRFDTGLSALEEALGVTNQNENRTLEAEIHRLKGELLLRRDDSNFEKAQRCFQRAIDVARAQSAKSWELRATTSVARLLAKQGRSDDALAILAAIYNWFTEGFDTADLKEAKALLEELSGKPQGTRPLCSSRIA